MKNALTEKRRLADDLIFGAAGIATEVGMSLKRTYKLLESGEIPARKIGGESGQWIASRGALRAHFESLFVAK